MTDITYKLKQYDNITKHVYSQRGDIFKSVTNVKIDKKTASVK